MSNIQPGWYKDPAEPTTQRYWDGEGWIGKALPADAEPPVGPPPEEENSPPPTPLPGNAVPEVAGAPYLDSRPPAPDHPPLSGQPAVSGQPPAPEHQPVPSQPAVSGQPPAPEHQPVSGQQQAGRRAGSVPVGSQHGWPYPPGRYLTRMPAPRPHGLALATPGARFVARVIDIAVLALLNLVVNGWFIWQYVKEISPTVDAWERYFTRQSTEVPENSPRSGYLNIVIILIAAALWLAYEVPAIANTGQTLGKRVLGIQVVRLEEPGPIGFARSLRRWNTLGLPTLLWACCGIGFVMQFVDSMFVLIDRPLMQALHDKSARTVVVSLLPTESPGAPGEPAHRQPDNDTPHDDTPHDDTRRDDTPGGAA